GVLAMTDDAVLFSQTDLTLYEYAIYQGGQVASHLAIVWPDTVCVQTSCSAVSENLAASGGSLPWYRYQSEPGNVLSYPSIVPTDIMTNFVALSALQGIDVGPPWQENIGQQSQTITSVNVSSTLGLQAQLKEGFEIQDFEVGAGIDLQGSY